jgi:hypothetical protein
MDFAGRENTLNSSEPERRLAAARRNILERHLQHARQAAITRQLRREGQDTEMAERVLRALLLRRQTAERALFSSPAETR